MCQWHSYGCVTELLIDDEAYTEDNKSLPNGELRTK